MTAAAPPERQGELEHDAIGFREALVISLASTAPGVDGSLGSVLMSVSSIAAWSGTALRSQL